MLFNFRAILILIFAGLLFLSTDALGRQISYDVSFRGMTDKVIVSDITSLSDTYRLKETPAASLNILKKRAEADLDVFLSLLRSRGLFKAEIEIRINENESPVMVIFHIKPGPFFIVRSVEFSITGDEPVADVAIPEPKNAGFTLNMPFASAEVLEGESRLISFIRRQGFPFAKTDKREIRADHSDDSVRIKFILNPGPKAVFGRTSITGLTGVDENFVRQKIPYTEGDHYNPDLITETQRALNGLGLFATVRITEGSELEENNSLPVNIDVNERRHRSIGAGLRYQKDEGPGIKASWEHRNLFHRGEKLELLSEYSNFILSAEARFRKPAFLRTDQTLRLGLRLASDEPEAYRSENLTASGLVDREIAEGLSMGAGITFKSAKITRISSKDRYSMISLPLGLEWDRSDDLLDPSKGGRLSLQISPYYTPSGSSLYFLKGLVTYRHYLNIIDSPHSILACKLALGTIKGASRDEIPADERFYAGGGGSIRGYAFQSAGPYSDGIPAGGKSLMELSLELRIKLAQQWGIIGFLDGGRAFSNGLFSGNEDIQWAAGMGVRYYTPIGPVRLDIGVPLKRREGIDDSFQIYINLGQSF